MNKQHITLTEDHQIYLRKLLAKGTLPVKTFKRATALLELHQGKTYQMVAQTLDLNYNTISGWAAKYQTQQLGFLVDKARSGRPLVIEGSQRARLTALACEQAPLGYSQWSLRLLANKAVELGYCDHLSHTHLGEILKKTSSNPTSNASGASVR